MIENIENYKENQPIFKIEAPREGDEVLLGPMHIRAWKESYVSPESGLTDEMVDDMLGHMLTNTDFRKNTISEAISNPDMVLYRVVRRHNGIVGFLHGSKGDEYNELNAIYLLNEVKGSGTGGKLMEEFLSWADKSKPCRLEVFSFNNQALGFYNKYGFVKTDKPTQLYKDKLPFVEMVRAPEKTMQE